MTECIDMLYPYGVASRFDHKELILSIRTVRRFLSGVRDIYVIGVDPGPVVRSLAHYIPYQQTARNKEACIAEVLSYGMKTIKGLSDLVSIQGDDHTHTRPASVWDFRAPAGISLRALANRRPRSNYSHALRDTSRYLESKGCGEIHFDYHMPMIVERARWLALEEAWKVSNARVFGMVCKSLYGNLQGVEPQYQADYKANRQEITLDEIYQATKDRPVISYGDRCAPLVFSLFSEYL